MNIIIHSTYQYQVKGNIYHKRVLFQKYTTFLKLESHYYTGES